MRNSEVARKDFWKLMQKELKERGNPFLIYPQYSGSSVRHYANVIKRDGVSLDVNFLVQDGILRICLYIDKRDDFYEFFKEKRDSIEKVLGFSIAFTAGEKNKDIKWIKREWSFIPYNSDDYTRVLKNALPDMIKFVEVFERFL